MRKPGVTDDRGFDTLLRQALEQAGPTSACLDAEAIAAWSESGLTPEEAATIERHLADCAHCQSVAAGIARSAPAGPVVLPLRDRRRLRWIVPLTAAAAAMVIWIATDSGRFPLREDAPVALPPAATRAAEPGGAEQITRAEPLAAEPDTAPLAEAARPAAPAPPAPAAGPADISAPEQREVAARTSGDAAGRMVDSLAALEAPLERAAAPLTRAVVDVASPDPSVGWRIQPDGRVDRTTSGGASWTSVPLPPGTIITAGSAPTASVCWLVGESGSVFVSEGAGLRRLSFPESVHLTAVTAASATSAVVTTSDGRMFTTVDGGTAWTPP
jgi:hypothetical protein